MDKFLKYFPLRKIDETTHTVWGVATSEAPDHDGEICDYEAAKVAVKTWSDDQFHKTTAAGQDPSLGNIRVMHQLQIGAKATKIEYHDEQKEIWVGSEPANDEVWHLLKGGFLTMYSVGGEYAWKKADGKYTRFGPNIGEISYVDKGSNPDAVFAYVKSDGSTELRKFATPGPAEKEILAKLQNSDIGRLSQEDVDRLSKAIAASFVKDASALSTRLEEITARVDDLMAKRTSAKGADMNKEQIEKCAKSLGITVEEFNKTYVEGDALEKGKKGLAALHSHLKKAIGVHGKLHEMHKAMSEHHKDLHEHLQDCMKAHGACQDGEEAEKVLKAATSEPEMVSIGKTSDGVQIFRKKADKEVKLDALTAPTGDFIKKVDVETMVKAALEEFKKSLPADDNADKIRIVPRDGVNKTEHASADPIPV